MRTPVKIGIVLVLIGIVIVGSVWARKYHSSDDAWLGVSDETVTSRLARKLDLAVKSGAYISKVYRDSPAREAGLKRGDVVTAVNSDEVIDADDLSDLIDGFDVDEEITLTVMRDSTQMTLKATLAERPDNLFSFGSSYFAPDVDVDIDDDVVIWSDDRDEQAYLGVELQGLNRQLGEYFGVERGWGVLISEVEKGSPADKAGMKAGDVITAIDGERTRDSDDAVEAIHDHEPGDTVSITVMRDRKEMIFKAELEEGDDSYYGGSLWESDGHGVRIGRVPPVPELPELPELPDLPGYYDVDQFDHPRVISRVYDCARDDYRVKRAILKDLRVELKDQAREMKELQEEIREGIRQDLKTEIRPVARVL